MSDTIYKAMLSAGSPNTNILPMRVTVGTIDQIASRISNLLTTVSTDKNEFDKAMQDDGQLVFTVTLATDMDIVMYGDETEDENDA